MTAALYNITAVQTLASTTQLSDVKRSADVKRTTTPRVPGAVPEETKSSCFTKAHFPGLLSKVN